MGRSRDPGGGGYTPPPPPDPRDAELSDDESRFVERWFLLRNRAAAYRECFPNVTARAARTLGSLWASRPHVRAEYEAMCAAQRRRFASEADEVVRELMRVAFSDVYHLFDEHDRVLPFRRLPFELRRAVAGIKVLRERETARRVTTTRTGTSRTRTTHTTTECVVEVKLWNKVDALKALAAHFGGLAPLEELLSHLPKPLADEVRRHLVPTPGAPSRNGDAPHPTGSAP